MPDTAIGIDFGSTSSCVGVYDIGAKFGFNKIAIFPNEHGNRTTPSHVAFNETGRLLGDAAKNQLGSNPPNTVWHVKRFLGCNFKSKGSRLDDFEQTVPFKDHAE